MTNVDLWTGNTYDNTGKVKTYALITNKYYDKNKNITSKSRVIKEICSFDVDEETARHEPWTGSAEDYKANLQAFLNGKIFSYPSGLGEYNYGNYNRNGKSFLEYYADSQFIETIGEYSTSTKDTFASSLNQGIRDNKNKRVIVYQLTN